MVFWAGLMGAVRGSIAGVYQKRRTPRAGPLPAAGIAVAIFVLITAIGAVAT